MAIEYEKVLHYRGNLTTDPDAMPVGTLFGMDVAGRIFCISAVLWEPDLDRTTLFLKYATPEDFDRHRREVMNV